jgi:hypothetical protein
MSDHHVSEFMAVIKVQDHRVWPALVAGLRRVWDELAQLTQRLDGMNQTGFVHDG